MIAMRLLGVVALAMGIVGAPVAGNETDVVGVDSEWVEDAFAEAFVSEALVAPNPDFPPNKVIYYKCRTDGPVSVCLYNRGRGELYNPRIKVTYASNGYLWNQGLPLSMWISVNGKSGNFGKFTADPGNPITSANQTTFADNAWYAPAGYRQCPVNERFPRIAGGPEQGKLIWYWDLAPADQFAMIPASTDPTVELQIAIKNDRNNWDSRNGFNYRAYVKVHLAFTS
ncbi:hypothetical protein HDU67_009107 [Dinochytrium kinnereticum]|nr:hypothetical protein HDU67_009107 [Dinochytrium kinnereticum]